MIRLRVTSIAALFCLVAVSARAAQDADAPDTPLITVGDGTPASCTQAALVAASDDAAVNGGGTIRFNCGSEPVTITLSETVAVIQGRPTALVLPDNTTIDGDGLIILDGEMSTHVLAGANVFVDQGSSAHLRQLSVTGHGLSGVVNEGTLIITDATFFGGAINFLSSVIHNDGVLTVKDSTFSGLVAGFGGGIFNTGTLTVKGSTFANNVASGAGGGIYNTGIAEIRGSTFDGNSAGRRGGAINNAGTLTVIDCGFVGNFGGRLSGAIHNGDPVIAGATFSIRGSVFIGNVGDLNGGALANSGSGSIEDSEFSGNRAFFGGAIDNGGTLTIFRTQIVQNLAGFIGGTGGDGGGVYNEGTGMLTIDHSEITHNTANHDGGGIWTQAPGTLTLKHTSVTGNTPDDIAP